MNEIWYKYEIVFLFEKLLIFFSILILFSYFLKLPLDMWDQIKMYTTSLLQTDIEANKGTIIKTEFVILPHVSKPLKKLDAWKKEKKKKGQAWSMAIRV